MSFFHSRATRVLRRLGRVPLFTAVAVLTLGVGIGANTAVFSVVYGVLLKPLPYPAADRLVSVWHTAPGLNIPRLAQSPVHLPDLPRREPGVRRHRRVERQRGLGHRDGHARAGRGPAGDRRRAADCRRAAVPRAPFTREDDSRRSPERAILTYAYWQRKFGEDRSVIGRTIMVDGRPREIVGVLPPAFRFLEENPQLVLPFRFDPGRCSSATSAIRESRG